MAGLRVEGGNGNIANVTTNNELKVSLGLDPDTIGGVRLFSENDDGSHTGVPYLKSPETSLDFRLRTGIDTLVFTDEFNAGAQNTANWFHRTTTMTMVQSGGFLVTNNNLTAAITTGCSIHTHRIFTLAGGSALCLEVTAGITAAPLGGQNILFGFGNCSSATTRPGDGVWFELTSTGLYGIQSYGGSITPTGIIRQISDFNIGQIDKYALVVNTHEIQYWCNDILLGKVECATGSAQPFLATSINAFIQQFNSSAVSGSPQAQLKVGTVSIQVQDIATNKTWAGQMAGMGLNAFQGQNGGTMGQTAQWSNTALPTAAAGTNTTAALGTGLGGLFQLNAMATSATDVIVSSYQNPLGSTTQSPGNLFIRGIWMDIVNTGAAVATTATILAIALAAGHNAVSLATTEAASFANGTTKAPRRLPLGIAAFKVGDVIGATQRIAVDFETPVVVHPGEFVQVVAKPILGTATASEVFVFAIGFNAYNE